MPEEKVEKKEEAKTVEEKKEEVKEETKKKETKEEKVAKKPKEERSGIYILICSICNFKNQLPQKTDDKKGVV